MELPVHPYIKIQAMLYYARIYSNNTHPLDREACNIFFFNLLWKKIVDNISMCSINLII